MRFYVLLLIIQAISGFYIQIGSKCILDGDCKTIATLKPARPPTYLHAYKEEELPHPLISAQTASAVEPTTVTGIVVGSLLLGLSLFFSNMMDSKNDTKNDTSGKGAAECPALSRAYNTLRYMYYDNTGGAVYSRTPAGMAENYKNILNKRDGDGGGYSDLDKVNMFLGTLEDPFTTLIMPRGGGETTTPVITPVTTTTTTKTKNKTKTKTTTTTTTTTTKSTTTYAGYGFLQTGAFVSLPTPSGGGKRLNPTDRTILPPSAISQFPKVTAVTPSSAAERAGVTVDTLVLRVGDSPLFNSEVGVRAFKVFSRINRPTNDGEEKVRNKPLCDSLRSHASLVAH